MLRLQTNTYTSVQADSCVHMCVSVCVCVCVCVYLLQGAEGGVSASEVEAAVSHGEGGQVSQSHVLRQQQSLDQDGLLALAQQLRHRGVQTQLCTHTHTHTRMNTSMSKYSV